MSRMLTFASDERRTPAVLELKIQDFGPIRSGQVSLKPLTVFVGPNNSGKSYLAMLFYALHGARYAGYGPRYRFHHQDDDHYYYPYLSFRKPELEEDEQATLRNWLAEQGSKGEQVCLELLPPAARKALEAGVKSYFEILRAGLAEELTRCFGTLLPELNRNAAQQQHFAFSISNTEPSWSFATRQAGKDLKMEEHTVDLSREFIRFGRRLSAASQRPLPAAIFVEEILNEAIGLLARSLPNAYYFPAARSGILHSHKALASFLVRQSPLVGLDRIEIPQLSGVITDFVGELLTIEKRRGASPITKIANDLEGSVLRGTVSLETAKTQYPEIYYEAGSGQFPLHRTSSMVSELAPIVLFLKHKVKPGDLLIVEEPESHLHPASQVRLAKAFAELVKAGVKILLTTHSDYFLEQIGNFIRAAKVAAEDRADPDLPVLGASEVGAYLFRATNNGTEVKRLGVSAEEGIPQDDFAQVTEALYRERISLQA